MRPTSVFFWVRSSMTLRQPISVLVLVGAVGALIALPLRCSLAQEEFFNPPMEVPPTKTPVGGVQVYSFFRYEGDFQALCAELEREGRRVPVVKLAEEGVDREKECITCRSFWKMIVSACSRLGPRPTPTAKPTKVPRPSGAEDTSTSSEKAESVQATAADTAEEPVATPTVGSVAKQGERVPSVELVDLASRLSTKAFDVDSGTGPTAHMFHDFAKRLTSVPGLNASEREYYEVFCSYLLAAWDGRVDRTKVPTPTPEARVLDQIFDFD